MITRFEDGSLLWIDILRPTAEEVRELMEELSIPPSLVSDLTIQVPKSSAVTDGSVLKLTLDFPIVRRTDINHPHEVKFLVSKQYLVTVHYEEMEAIDKFKKQFELVATLHRASKRANGAHIFLALMTELYRTTSSKLDYIEAQLNDIEARILDGDEKKLVFEISRYSKKLICFKQTLKAHERVFAVAEPYAEAIFKQHFTKELQELQNEYTEQVRHTAALFESLNELRETNMALLTTKQNEIMKILTIMAFITFPLTLLTSMFGMNTETTPIVGKENDFWVIVGIMTAATISFFTFFKYKNWI